MKDFFPPFIPFRPGRALALAGALLATAGAARGQTPATFAAVSTYSTGTNSDPRDIAVADVNGDGRPDLVTANSGTGTAGVLLGTGTGTFGAVTTYSTGGNGLPDGIVAADVNGDGRPDIVAANSNSGTGTVGVLLGQAGGGFAAVSTYSTGANSLPDDVAVADVNGDGQPDIVTANSGTNTAGVLLGTGTGTFGAVTTYSTGASSQPLAIAVADVNGDGRPDIVTANFNSNTAGVLLGTGTGTFGAVTTYSTGASSQPRGIAVADVNGDGRPDLVTVNYISSTAGVLLGQAGGGFAAVTTYSFGANNLPQGIAVADVNGDGRPDLVTANSNDNTAGVLLGQAGGGFAAVTTYFVGINSGPYGVAVADVNGDGQLDLVTANVVSDRAGVLLNTTATTAPTLTSLSPTSGSVGTSVTLTGTNLTGTTSIAFTGAAGQKVVSSGFTVNGAGTQITGVVVPAGAQSGPVTVTAGGNTSAGSMAAVFWRVNVVAAGGNHTVAVRADGTLWAWGLNGYGQLGNGTTTNSSVPVQVGTATTWASIAAGVYHTVAVRTDGTLWAWGFNSSGQLGTGTTSNSSVPVQVGTSNNWVSVAVGAFHTVAVRTDGTLWAWGFNNAGQLGTGTTSNSSVPVQVGTSNNWVSAAAGLGHTAAVRSDGTLWAWGAGGNGQLGDGTTSQRITPVQVGTGTTWAGVAAGNAYTAATRSDGTLWAWGLNSDGQLGDGTTTQRTSPVQVGTGTDWANVAAGFSHTVAVRSDGTLWTWGSNSNGQLGSGGSGAGANSVPTQVGSGTNWVNAAAHYFDTVGEQSCRAVWAWGDNTYGQVGDGTTTQRNSPVQVYNPVSVLSFAPASAGAGATVTVTGTGLAGLTSLTVNGANALASIAGNTDAGFTFVVPTGAALGPGTVTAAAGCGTASSAAFTVLSTLPTLTALNPRLGTPGSVLTLTGTNLTGTTAINFTGAAGQKIVSSGFTINGTGTQITGVVVPAGAQSGPVTVTAGGNMSAVGMAAVFWRANVVAAGNHTVTVRADGTLWTWGLNSNGQLGNGTTTNSAVSLQVGTATTWASVAVGAAHTVAVRTDGTLWTWGTNGAGQLGNGTTTRSLAPVQVGTGTNWVSVATGTGHTVALRADGTLWTWGDNSNGQLGNGTTTNSAVPIQVGTNTTWTSVAAAYYQTLAMRVDGTIWAWGSNAQGQLGNGTTTSSSVPVQVGTATTWTSVAAGLLHTVATRADGTLWAWGFNNQGQLGNGGTARSLVPAQSGTNSTWASVASGNYHTVAIRANGTLWTWGDNFYGELGNGTGSGTFPNPTQVGTGTNWVSAATANDSHTVAEQSCRAIWAWGDNTYGQVGDGTTTQRNSPVQVYNLSGPLTLAPSSAAPGATVTATGTNLAGVSALTVNGANALGSVVNNTNTGFTFVVPAGASPGAGTVTVTAGCGVASSAAFTVLVAPTLTSLSPASGAVGSTVLINGTTLTGTTVITFAGSSGNTVTSGFIVNAAGTQITGVVVPSGAITGNVTVTTGAGTSNALAFTITVPLTITSTTPVNNTRAASATGPVSVTFDQALTSGSTAALKVFSQQRGGLRTGHSGNTSLSGNTVSFAPTYAFKPGETVQATVTTAATATAGGILAAPKVVQFTTAAGAGPGTFSGGSDLGVGTGTISVAVGDIDGDGDLDMLAANNSNFTISVRFNNGSGLYSGGYELPTGDGLSDIVLADVDGDGDLDLLASFNNTNFQVYVFRNNGSGGFGSTTIVPIPQRPFSIAVGDVDGDGDLDLLTANVNTVINNPGTITVRLNNGSGAFSGGSDLSVGCCAHTSLALGDVDGDGDLDLLTNNEGSLGTVSVRLNNGNGVFSGGSDPAVGNGPRSVAVADVDGDGDLDLLTANSSFPNGIGTVSIRLNNGSGTFSGGSDLSVGNYPESIAVGDVDGDGDLDLLTANDDSPGTVSVRLNNGIGTFSGGSDPVVGSNPTSIAVGDVDGDGDLDLLTANIVDNTVSVRINQNPVLTLTSLSPSSGTIGSTITINGTNLTGTTMITFAGTSGNTVTGGFIVNGAGTQIMGVVVPGGATTGNVTVSTGAGTSNGLAFSILYPDLIVSTGTQASPTAVAAGTYNSITVTGTGVAQLGGSTVVNSSVTVNGTLLTNCQALTGAANVTVVAGATLGICDPAGLSSAAGTGAVHTTGTRSFSAAASYVYNGTAAQVTGNALPNQVLNLTTTNALPLTLTQPVRVKQVLTVGGAGNVVLNGQALTLLSDASGTALVVNSSTGVVQGSTGTMQRYIDASGNLGASGYRHYSAPVTGSTVADLSTSTFTPTLNMTYNTSTTPTAVQPFPTVYGYDETRLATSTATGMSDFDKGWFSPATLADPLAVGRGYTVQLGNAELVDFTGTFNTGPRTLGGLMRGSQPDAGWHLVGNPYPAPLDWSSVTSSQLTAVNPAIYIYQSTGPYVGQYRSLVNGVGAGSSLIPAGQGFFVRASTAGTTGSIALADANRATTFAGQPALQRATADPRPRLRLSLGTGSQPATPATAADETFVYLEAGATPAFDGAFDANKLANPSGYYLASTSTAAVPVALSVNGRPPLGTTDDVIPLWLSAPAGAYTITATELANLTAPTGALTPYLRDALTGTFTDLSRQASYSFAVAAGAPYAGRFALVLRPASALGTAPGAPLAGALASLYPNPTAAETTLSATGLPASAVTLEAMLLDALGRTVGRYVLPVYQGMVSQGLPTGGLSAGLYLLRLRVHNAQTQVLGALPSQRLVVR